jgi:hypothetical protein
MKADAASRLDADSAVFTADHKRLGRVKDVRGEFFQVDARLQPDYWINVQYIINADAEGVHLSFDGRDLGAYKQQAPAHDPSQAPVPELQHELAASKDSVLSEEEQLEQRLHMEQELAKQRQNIEDDRGTVGVPVEEEIPELETELDGGELGDPGRRGDR